LLFPSSHSASELTTLDEYVQRMPEYQKDIYYISGKDRIAVENLPQLETLKEKNIEILYLFDKIDEFAVDNMRDFKEKKLKSVTRGNLEFENNESESKSDQDKSQEESKCNNDFLNAIKEYLKDKVVDVHESKRLKSSAVCLVSDDTGVSVSMENLLRGVGQSYMKARRILEVNPKHDIFIGLKKVFEENPNSPLIKDFSEILYEQAVLIEGQELENPSEFANKITNLMVKILE